MTLITTIHESLPYIDANPTAAQHEAAEALIAAERAAVADDPHHALLSPAYEPSFTALMRAELERVAASSAGGTRAPLRAIDLSRYEAQEPLGAVDGRKKGAVAAQKEKLQTALQRAYASQTYLAARRAQLALLDSYGKNAWLVGNWQLEAELKALETELAAAKRDIDVLTVRRQRAQADVGAEMKGLEEGWRKGVSKVLETEIAAEELRSQVLEIRRTQG